VHYICMDTLVKAAEQLSVTEQSTKSSTPKKPSTAPKKPANTSTAPRKPRDRAKKQSAVHARQVRATLVDIKRQEAAEMCVSPTSTPTTVSPTFVPPNTELVPTTTATTTTAVTTTELAATLATATPIPPPSPPPAPTTTTDKKGTGRACGSKNWVLIDIICLLDAWERFVPATEDEYTATLMAMNTALVRKGRPTRNMDPMKDKFRKLYQGAPTGQSGFSEVQKRARAILDSQQAKLDISILNDAEEEEIEGDMSEEEAQLISVLASSDGVSKKEHQQAGQAAFKLLKRAFDQTSNNNNEAAPKPKRVSVNRSVQQIVEIASNMLVQAQQDSEVRNKLMMKLIEKL